jgi:hypothetical protein
VAEARNPSSTGAHLAGVLAFGLALGRHFLLTAELAVGGPLQQVVATDGTERLLGTRGPTWNLGLGLGIVR